MDAAYKENRPVVDGVTPKIISHMEHDVTAVKAHYHSYIELLYCLKGDFKAWLGNTGYDFYTGDLLIINSNEIHMIESDNGDAGEYIVLRFEPEILYHSAQDIFDARYAVPFMPDGETPQKVLRNSEIYNTEIPRLMHDAYEEYTRGEYGYELAMRADICRIFMLILRYWSSKGINTPGRHAHGSEQYKSIKKVLDYMTEHYSENISANSMAQLANMSYSHFSKVFSKIMNRSFNDQLNYIRVTEAERMLASTDMNITEIAYSSGFSSSSYFIKIFEKYKGISPMQFRKRFLLH